MARNSASIDPIGPNSAKLTVLADKERQCCQNCRIRTCVALNLKNGVNGLSMHRMTPKSFVTIAAAEADNEYPKTLNSQSCAVHTVDVPAMAGPVIDPIVTTQTPSDH